jgi:hypothetical protein
MSEHIDQYKEEAREDMASARGQAGATTKPARREGNAWIAGLVLIGIGVIFLLNQFTPLDLDNWWALFILIPALAAFGNAWRTRQTRGSFGREGRGSLIGGFVLTFVAAVFLFELDWGVMWPVFLILAGVGVLLGSFWN